MTNTKFAVPQREDVSANNQAIFDNLKKGLGFVPNAFATIAYSDKALETYLNFSNAKSSLSKKEKEVVNLSVSEVNGCDYCLAAHTAIGKLNGFSEEQTFEIRKGEVSFDSKLDALAKFAKEAAITKGRVSETTLDNFLNAGYTKASVIDVVLAIADITVTNYVNNIAGTPIDFPLAKALTN
ncbi:alkylhydroperoxidase [Arachidicoccus ginsenosidimutans]|uniref:carboxymuconolactone decarboxylase family protein n=1 Tax=Arachidicoccus sp. BS20 TaxID=1850526 RepID=UPI0007F12612|nr:carboxymuconolactone decarboxylase family protein [Arachidicoccus sp. BS20]ANI88148.1 alkylhydroperoxidase [Arachidicoccus sp. BS20]